jgi:hypothetical protein
MNQERFDELTRSLADGRLSRGRMLKMLAMGIVGTVVGGGGGMLLGTEGARGKEKPKPPKAPKCKSDADCDECEYCNTGDNQCTPAPEPLCTPKCQRVVCENHQKICETVNDESIVCGSCGMCLNGNCFPDPRIEKQACGSCRKCVSDPTGLSTVCHPCGGEGGSTAPPCLECNFFGTCVEKSCPEGSVLDRFCQCVCAAGRTAFTIQSQESEPRAGVAASAQADQATLVCCPEGQEPCGTSGACCPPSECDAATGTCNSCPQGQTPCGDECCTPGCETCENGACVSSCGPCQTCQDGQCRDSCGACEECVTEQDPVWGFVSRCEPIDCGSPCLECREGACFPKECGPCETCN